MDGSAHERQRDLDERVYALAGSYLLGQEGISQAMLDQHVRPSPDAQRPTTLAAIYERLLRSAQSAQSMPNVIGGSIGGIERLNAVLFDFDPVAVVERYPRSEEGCKRLFDTIREQLCPEANSTTIRGVCGGAFVARSLPGLPFLRSFLMHRHFTDGSSRST